MEIAKNSKGATVAGIFTQLENILKYAKTAIRIAANEYNNAALCAIST